MNFKWTHLSPISDEIILKSELNIFGNNFQNKIQNVIIILNLKKK